MTAHLFNPRCKDSWGELANLKHKDFGKVSEVSKVQTVVLPAPQTEESKQVASPLQKELMEAKERIRLLEEELRKRDGI